MSTDEPPPVDRVAIVSDELGQVAIRLVPRVFGKLGRQGALPIPQLRLLCEAHFPDEWRTAQVVALELMLRRGIEQLEGWFGDAHRIPRREVALRLFNLDGSPEFPNIRPIDVDDVKYQGDGRKNYDIILGELQNAAGLHEDPSTLRRRLKALRDALAKALVFKLGSDTAPADMAEIEPGLQLVVRSARRDEFVPRPTYMQEIRKLRDAGVRRLWLHGDAGTGKSRLARAANNDVLGEESTPLLRASDSTEFERQVSDLLVRSGVKPEVINPANLRAVFLDALRAGRLPRFMVLDDMPDSDLIEDLDMETPSMLLFTSIKAPPRRYNGHTLQVGEMTPDEAARLIRSRLGEVDDNVVGRLLRALGARPLAIEHSCFFLRESGIAVKDYCVALGEQPAQVLELAGNRSGRTLTRVYELIIDQLSESPDVLQVLDDLLFMNAHLATLRSIELVQARHATFPHNLDDAEEVANSPEVISFAMVAQLPGVVHIDEISMPSVLPLTKVLLSNALRRLLDFGLIRFSGQYIVMHQLTRTLLRALRSDRSRTVHERILRTVDKLVKQEKWRSPATVPNRLILWAPHVDEALLEYGLESGGLRQIDSVTLMRVAILASLSMHTYRQIGWISNEKTANICLHAYYELYFRFFYGGDAANLSPDGFFEEFQGVYIELIRWRIRISDLDQTLEKAIPFNVKFDDASLRQLGDRELHEIYYSPQQALLAAEARLENESEWQEVPDSPHADFSLCAQAISVSQAGLLLGGGPEASLKSARFACLAASIYCADARWNDALSALEHAYSCYYKVVGKADYVRRAMDAARRLAHVNLRSGNLDDATLWLARAESLYAARSGIRVRGHLGRFAFKDLMLEIRMRQVLSELEFTRLLLEFDETPEVDCEMELGKFANGSVVGVGVGESRSRTDEIHSSIAYLQNTAGASIVPEFRMYAIRLAIASGVGEFDSHVAKLEEWFSRESLTCQRELLHVQLAIFKVRIYAGIASMDEGSRRELLSLLPDAVRRNLAFIVGNLKEYSRSVYGLVRRMYDEHKNIYWYARGLCAAYILADVAELPKAWMVALRAEMENACRLVNRPDWVDKAYGFGYSNGGLWLIGY